MHSDIGEGLKPIFDGIRHLQGCCQHGRKFTVDGRLVGDIGELVATREFAITPDKPRRANFDAVTESDKRNVQIKATFLDHLGFKQSAGLYIGIKLYPNGNHDVVYNGLGSVIMDHVRHRAGAGEKLISISISLLAELNKDTRNERFRVPFRKLA